MNMIDHIVHVKSVDFYVHIILINTHMHTHNKYEGTITAHWKK